MIILTLGLPGAGKGAVARKLRETFSFDILATGELIRREIFADTELGKKIKAQFERGDFVDDEIVIDMVEKHITDKKNIVLVGFPRNLKQAEALDEILQDNGRAIDSVIYFDSDAEEDVRRLAARRVCPTCHAVFNTIIYQPKVEGVCDRCESKLIWREDDHPENILHKIDIYRQFTKPLRRYYEEQGILTEIDARQSTLNVFYDVIATSQKFTTGNF